MHVALKHVCMFLDYIVVSPVDFSKGEIFEVCTRSNLSIIVDLNAQSKNEH